MIEILSGQGNDTARATQGSTGAQKILRMEKHDRTGGSIPIWEDPQSAAQNTQAALSAALLGKGEYQSPFEQALTTQQNLQNPSYNADQEEFGIGDFVDMLNPLQHIPLVNHMYRELTGDEIRPIAQIVGGGVFGGPLGAAGGLMNAVSVEETGKDFTQNAMDMVTRGETPSFKPNANDAETQLALASSQSQELPGTTLAFADLSAGTNRPYAQRISAEPTAQVFAPAGSIQISAPNLQLRPSSASSKPYAQRLDNLPAREPITELRPNAINTTVHRPALALRQL